MNGMSVRASIVSSLVLSLGFTCSAQISSMNSTRIGGPQSNLASSPSNGIVSGTVRSINDHAVPDARIELHSESGELVANGYTDSQGRFALSQVANGTYEIVALKGINETRDRIFVVGNTMAVDLRMAIQAATVGNNVSVSVAQFRVPEKARKIYEKASEALHKNKFDDAKKLAQKALDTYPQFAEALTLRGILEMNDGATDRGMADFDAAIKADPSYALAYTTMGAALNQTRKYEDAARSLSRAVALQPGAWQPYYELAKSSLGQGNYKEALKNISKACEISQEYAPVHLVRAHALLGMKMYQDAVGELELYLTREPSGAAAEAARKTLSSAKSFASLSASK